MGDGTADGTSEGELGVELEAAGGGLLRGGSRHYDGTVLKKQKYLNTEKKRIKNEERGKRKEKEWVWEDEAIELWQQQEKKRKTKLRSKGMFCSVSMDTATGRDHVRILFRKLFAGPLICILLQHGVSIDTVRSTLLLMIVRIESERAYPFIC